MAQDFFLPKEILSSLGIPAPVDVWIRIVAVLALNLGYFFYRLSQANYRPFFLWSVHARWFFAAVTVGLVASRLAQVYLLLFGLVDLLGGLWTFWAVRRESMPGAV